MFRQDRIEAVLDIPVRIHVLRIHVLSETGVNFRRFGRHPGNHGLVAAGAVFRHGVRGVLDARTWVAFLDQSFFGARASAGPRGGPVAGELGDLGE